MIDFSAYIENLTKKCVYTQDFQFCRVTGVTHLEEFLAGGAGITAAVCVDTVAEGSTTGKSGTYFCDKNSTVFILRKFNTLSMADRDDKMEECRVIYRSFLSRMIRDKNRQVEGLEMFKTDRIPFWEVEGFLFTGFCGIYFNVNLSCGQDMTFRQDEWED